MRPRRVSLALFASTTILISSAARATCTGPAIEFGQLSMSCGAGSSYCYVRSPGTNATDAIRGSFSSLGSGNPVVGAGNDSGAWLPHETWLVGYDSGSELTGTWGASGQIDGCIDGAIAPGETSEIMVVGLSDTDIFGSRAFFAAAAVARNRLASPQFDFAGGIARDIVMARIPPPRCLIGSTSAQFFRPSLSDISPGFYTDGSTNLDQVIVGYRIYYRTGLPVPSDRRRSAWTAFSPVIGINQDWTAPPQCFCCGAAIPPSFVMALVFSGGFESDYVSQPKSYNVCIPERSQDLDDNGELPPDMGGADCNDDDPTIYPGAPEINDGRDNQCPGNFGYGSIDEISGKSGFYHPGDKTKFTWWSQDGASLYELARSDRPDFAGSCTTVTTPLTIWTDPEEPAPGGAFHYLVRAVTPHVGSWGVRSGGAERAIACP